MPTIDQQFVSSGNDKQRCDLVDVLFDELDKVHAAGEAFLDGVVSVAMPRPNDPLDRPGVPGLREELSAAYRAMLERADEVLQHAS